MTVSFFAEYKGTYEEKSNKSKIFLKIFTQYLIELEMDYDDNENFIRLYSDELEIKMEFLNPDVLRKITIKGKNEGIHKSIIKEMYEISGIDVYECRD